MFVFKFQSGRSIYESCVSRVKEEACEVVIAPQRPLREEVDGWDNKPLNFNIGECLFPISY